MSGINNFFKNIPNNYYKNTKENKSEIKNYNKKIEFITSLQELEGLIKEKNNIILKNYSSNYVFADGNNKSQIMIIGDISSKEDIKSKKPLYG